MCYKGIKKKRENQLKKETKLKKREIKERETNKQAMSYNVTMRRVLVTIVAAENQLVLHIQRVFICSLRYPACNAYAPYYHLCPAPIYNIFQIIL